MIRFRCKECGKKLKANEDIIGRKVKCTRCENVEMVPAEDNLTRPVAPNKDSSQLATNEPNPVVHSGSSASDSSTSHTSLSDSDVFDSLLGDDDTLLGDDNEAVEMVGDAAPGPEVVDTSHLRFRQFERKKSDFKRLVPFALIGLAIVGIVFAVFNSGWLFNSGPRFDPKFEALPAVANYRRAQNQLEKSRRVMMVMGEAVIAQNSLSQELIDELNEFNALIIVLSQKSDSLAEATKLVELGNQAEANKLLTDEAIIMDDRKYDVDLMTEKYNDLGNSS